MVFSNDWDLRLKDELEKPYFKELTSFLESEYKTETVYPEKENIFTALKSCSFKDTKVVIIGQDPYHSAGQAHGLCFSVLNPTPPPPSLKNIFKELEADVGFKPTGSGDLSSWAKQGVLMLNSVLTVREGKPNSHKGKGWETFTSRVILELNKKETPVVFLLWGNPAKQKAKVITNPVHVKLESVHPSPLSAYGGFFGCGHFSKCNKILTESGQTPINWQI